jgi:hypothetical protein
VALTSTATMKKRRMGSPARGSSRLYVSDRQRRGKV